MVKRITVVLGSKSDLQHFDGAKVPELLGELPVEVSLNIVSAHRNEEKLKTFCEELLKFPGSSVVVAGAGMAAALPGAMASHLKHRIAVIGVPLPSPGFENCMDSMLAMLRMPPGVPVLVVPGFKNAIIAALEVLATGDGEMELSLHTHLMTKSKKPQFNIVLDPEKRGE